MIARELMTQGVLTIGGDASVMDAMQMMVERRVTSLIVEKAAEDGLYGIVTRKDLVNKVIGCGEDPRSVKVADVMSKPLRTISPEMCLEDIVRLMDEAGIRRFPVMENGKLVGLVSNSDILKAFVLENM